MKTLYPNIDAERARRGLTVEQLSNKLGVTRKTYYNWITKGKIPQQKILKMADMFNTTVEYLLKTTA